MSRSFAPSFQHFQKDIERCLKSKGQVEKNELGQTVYRGYQAELGKMFRTYIDEGALALSQGALGRRRYEAQNQLQQDQKGSEVAPEQDP